MSLVWEVAITREFFSITFHKRAFFEKMLEDENFKPSPEKDDKSFFEKVKDMFS